MMINGYIGMSNGSPLQILFYSLVVTAYYREESEKK